MSYLCDYALTIGELLRSAYIHYLHPLVRLHGKRGGETEVKRREMLGEEIIVSLTMQADVPPQFPTVLLL